MVADTQCCYSPRRKTDHAAEPSAFDKAFGLIPVDELIALPGLLVWMNGQSLQLAVMGFGSKIHHLQSHHCFHTELGGRTALTEHATEKKMLALS